MNSQRPIYRVFVLSLEETRSWHSPFSRELRTRRRQQILAQCVRSARRAGCRAYRLYDAFENLVAAGDVTSVT